MSRDKQIEEMASIAYPGLDHQTVFSSIVYAQPLVNLYNAGYRKQIVGEWKLGKSGCMYFCSSCGYSAFPREEEEWNFCPRCGTKMKGGAE